MSGLFGGAIVEAVQAPQAITPPPAPPVEEAMMKEFEEGEVGVKKKKAKALGAKTLQIPLAGAGDIGTVGTV